MASSAEQRGRAEVAPSRVVGSALVLVALVALFGLAARWRLEASGLARPRGTNIYYRLYALYEAPHLTLLVVFAAASAVLLLLARRSRDADAALPAPADRTPLSHRHVALAAVVAVLVAAAIGRFVLHGLLFSMDEFTADFQARIFARGEYAPVVPWPWRSLQDAIAPIFVRFHADTGRWASVYLPVYSALKAAFVVLGTETWLNPILTGATVVVLALVARQLWPDERLRPTVAVALLVTSSQFVLTSGTGYAMPAHLLFNLVWLWLYLRGGAASWGMALVVGVLAMGLHNPFPHTLFVAPFMLRLLRERRWGRLGTAAAAYVAGAALWLTYLRWVDPVVTGAEQGLLSLFRFPDVAAGVLLMMNVALLLAWHAPILGVLAFAALSHPRRLPAPVVDLALGVLATLAFFAFYPSTQGHGWGYRYAHQVLGNLCLLAAAGVPVATSAFGDRRARQWLAAGVAYALVAQIPLRLHDTSRFVEPFAAGVNYVRSRNAAVVLVQDDSVWYERDLIRNTPDLRLPVVVRRERLAPSLIAQLKAVFPGRVHELTDAELVGLGMTPIDRRRAYDPLFPTTR